MSQNDDDCVFWKISNIAMVLFIYLGFYVIFNSVQVISRWVVGRAEETSTYSWSTATTSFPT